MEREMMLHGLPQELEGMKVNGAINAAIVEQIRKGNKTVDSIAFGIGLKNLCRFFHWQGGTIHQAKLALKWYLIGLNIYENRQTGELGTFTFGA